MLRPPVKDEFPPPEEPAPAPAAVEQLLPASPSLPPPAAPGNPEPAGQKPEADPAVPEPEPSEPPKEIEAPRSAWEEIQIRVEPPELELPRQLPQGPKPMWQEMMESQDPPMPPPLQPSAQHPAEQVQLPPNRPATGRRKVQSQSSLQLVPCFGSMTGLVKMNVAWGLHRGRVLTIVSRAQPFNRLNKPPAKPTHRAHCRKPIVAHLRRRGWSCAGGAGGHL